MSPAALTMPQSPVSGYRSATPSPTLSHKTVSGRSPLTIVPSTVLSRSPVIKAVASSASLVPAVSMAVQQQHHTRSQSLPGLQDQFPKHHDFPANAVWDNIQSSAAGVLSQKRENILGSQAYTHYIPKSPRLMPLMSPGAVTPMELEEDIEYRFPNLITPLRHSPLVAALTISGNVEDVESESEQVTEQSRRSR